MSKLIMLFFAAVAFIQVIKPLGWPGLKQRKDAWKLAVAGFAVMIALIVLRPVFNSVTSTSPSNNDTAQTD